MSKTAIIIVTYNSQKFLPKLLGSLFEYQSEDVVIVDNNSADDTVQYIKKNYPQVTLLEQKANTGFTGGNNIGLEYALSKGYDYVFLLNHDTMVTSGFLEKLLEALKSREKISSVQPLLKRYPETDKVNSYGCVIHYLGFGYAFGDNQQVKDFDFKNKEVNYCSGAAVLIKTEAIRKVGLLNDDFFMYHEDLELGWRFRLAGFKQLVVPSAVVYHQYEFSRSIRKYYYMERNRFIVLFTCYHLLTLLLILPALIIMEFGLLVFSFVGGWWKEKLKAYLYFLNINNWLKIFKRRQKVQGLRMISEKEAISAFSGKIMHQEVENPLWKVVNPLFNLYWRVVKLLIVW